MGKYYILCVAGQSNAVGYDESVIPRGYMSGYQSPRIKQLGFYGEDNLRWAHVRRIIRIFALTDMTTA